MKKQTTNPTYQSYKPIDLVNYLMSQEQVL